MDFERAEPAADGNHPLAERMGVIAGFAHNIIVGTVFGTFSVMLPTVPSRLGVSIEAASAALPLVLIESALLASIVGLLLARYSLRRLMIVASVMALAGFLVLAFVKSYAAYLGAYCVLLAPALAVGMVAPATLVTRWFAQGRGLALGMVHVPILVAVLPIVIDWLVMNHGAQAGYLLPAGLIAFVLLPLTALASDHPPASTEGARVGPTSANPAVSPPLRRIVRMPRFWALVLGGSAVGTGALLLGTVLGHLAVSWGFGQYRGAFLTTVMALAGFPGAIFFGWLADRIGGARGLAVLCFDLALLWAFLLFRPSFAAVTLIIALIGMHGAGMVANLGRGLSDAYGTAVFSRAFGLATTLSLPLTVVVLVGSSRVFAWTGSFSGAIAGVVALYAIAAALTWLAARRPAVESAAISA